MSYVRRELSIAQNAIKHDTIILKETLRDLSAASGDPSIARLHAALGEDVTSMPTKLNTDGLPEHGLFMGSIVAIDLIVNGEQPVVPQKINMKSTLGKIVSQLLQPPSDNEADSRDVCTFVLSEPPTKPLHVCHRAEGLFNRAASRSNAHTIDASGIFLTKGTNPKVYTHGAQTSLSIRPFHLDQYFFPAGTIVSLNNYDVETGEFTSVRPARVSARALNNAESHVLFGNNDATNIQNLAAVAIPTATVSMIS